MIPKYFKIDFLTTPNSTKVSWPNPKAIPSEKTSEVTGIQLVFFFFYFSKIAVTKPLNKKKLDGCEACAQLS